MNQAKGYKRALRDLYDVAAEQQGYFTAAQALRAGYSDELHGYHVRRGNWERIQRGVYRLTHYPPAHWPELVILSLWSRGRDGVPQGTISHETALAVHGLPGGNRSPMHLTVPPAFRRSIPLPQGILLHKAVLAETATVLKEGFRVTTERQTLRDLAPAPRRPRRPAVVDMMDTADLTDLQPAHRKRRAPDWAAWDSKA